MTLFIGPVTTLFPDVPCLLICPYNANHYHPGLYQHYDIYFPDIIRSAAPKRQAEFLAGRYSAKLALQKLGADNERVMTGKQREPLWPDGIVASLSHDHQHAVCLAAKRDRFTAAGVDIEPVMSLERVEELKTFFCCPEEEDIIRATDLPHDVSMTLLYSAKEALYKALCPQITVNTDFYSARVKSIDIAGKYLTLELTETLSPALTTHCEFTARFYRLPDAVLTCFLW